MAAPVASAISLSAPWDPMLVCQGPSAGSSPPSARPAGDHRQDQAAAGVVAASTRPASSAFKEAVIEEGRRQAARCPAGS